jgi:hypothetical protein
MDELTGRLEALFRHYAAAFDRQQGDGVQLAGQFRTELRLLILQYGRAAVDAAIEGIPTGEAWPSVSLH